MEDLSHKVVLATVGLATEARLLMQTLKSVRPDVIIVDDTEEVKLMTDLEKDFVFKERFKVAELEGHRLGTNRKARRARNKKRK